eukprot:641830-Pleurochrysis_carterae.AAC.1
MCGKTVNQHQPSFTKAPGDQDTVNDPTVLFPGNDAGVGDNAVTTSFTSLHELQTPSNHRPGGKAAKFFHNETAGFAAAAAAASAPNGAFPGASVAPNTVDRRANFGKEK